MAFSLFCARGLMRDDMDLVVSYGDIVYEPRVLASVLSDPSPISVAIDIDWRRYWEMRMPNPLSDAETLKTNAAGRIREIGRKAESYEEIEGQYIGLFKIRSNCVPQLVAEYDAMDRNQWLDNKPFEQMYMTSYLQHLIDQGWHVQAVPTRNGWLELDTIEDFYLYDRLAASGTLSTLCAAA
jgi:choline kinase